MDDDMTFEPDTRGRDPEPHWVWIPVTAEARRFARKVGEERGREMEAQGVHNVTFNPNHDRWYLGALGEAAWRLLRTDSFRFGAVRCPSCYKYQPHVPKCVHCSKEIRGMDWQRGAVGDDGMVELKTTRGRTLYVSRGTVKKKAMVYVALVVTDPNIGKEKGVWVAGWATKSEVAASKVIKVRNPAHAMDVYFLRPYESLSPRNDWKGGAKLCSELEDSE